jgi:hypothetical protein
MAICTHRHVISRGRRGVVESLGDLPEAAHGLSRHSSSRSTLPGVLPAGS